MFVRSPLLLLSALSFSAPDDDPTKKSITITEDELNRRIAEAAQKAAVEAATKATSEALARAAADKAAEEAAASAEKSRLESEKKAAEDKAAAQQKALDEMKAGGERADAQLRADLEASRLEIKSLETAIKGQAEEAKNQRVRDQLDAYKANAVKGLRLPDLVTGATPEEIDASVAKVKARELELFGALKEEARKEVIAGLPRPLQPGSGSADSAIVSPADRSKIAKIRDPKEYEAERAKRLVAARESLRRSA